MMIAAGIGPGDEVITTSFSFFATAEVISLVGATPVFVDIQPDTYNLDPAAVRQALTARTKAIMPVALYGQPADMDELADIARERGLPVIEDAAQSFGARYKDRKSCGLSVVSATSFFPAKPLGCYGDGGAVITDDPALVEILKSLRVHGQGTDKYDNVRIGMNARLDTLQAAILIEKLAIFPGEMAARQRIANRYNALLANSITTPRVPVGLSSAWAQYTLTAASTQQREHLQAALSQAGVPTLVYYPKPLHQQTAYKHFPTATGGALTVAENLASRVFSLPMHPYLEDTDINYIAEVLINVLLKAA